MIFTGIIRKNGKEEKEFLESIFGYIQDEILKMKSKGMVPDHIICDAEHYELLKRTFALIASTFTGGIPINDQEIKFVSIFGDRILIIQRVEKEFAGINIYGLKRY